MVTAVTAVTALVAIAKVTVVALAGTVTVAGTVAALRLLLARVTTAPPAGAALPSATVPVLPAAPVTAVGLTLTAASEAVGGFTAVTALVVTANVALVAPAATVTDAGTVAALRLLLASVTTAPPAGAAVPSVTLPVLPTPPNTAAGLTVTPISGGFSVSVTILDAPTHVAVMLACVTTVTAFVVTAKLALVAPAATVTAAGTVAAFVLLLVSVTTAPPAGAALVSVTLPVLPAPPISTEGFSVNEPSSGFTTSPTGFEMPL